MSIKIDTQVLFFDFTPTPDELLQWKKTFEDTSLYLYHATNAQLQFGTITYRIDQPVSDRDQILIEESDSAAGTAYASEVSLSHPRHIGQPRVVLHEFSHFKFNLGDEYDLGVLGTCTDKPEDQSCLMQYTIEPVSEYCHSMEGKPGFHQHTKRPMTQQHCMHADSCWDTILRRYPSFTVPQPKRKWGDEPDHSGHQPIQWIAWSKDRTDVLVLDQFADNLTPQVKLGQHLGAEFWINMKRLAGGSLGIVANDGKVLLPTQMINEDALEKALRSIELKPGGKTDIAHLINVLASELEARGLAATNRSLVWLTGDKSQAYPPSHDPGATAGVLKQVHADSLAMGDASPFTDLTEATNGKIHAIQGKTDDDNYAFRLLAQLMELAFRFDRGYQQVNVWGSRTFPYINGGRNVRDPIGGPMFVTEDQFQENIYVEPGVLEARFGHASNSACTLELVDPDGVRVLGAGVTNPVDGFEEFSQRFSGYRVEKPKPGVWKLKIKKVDLKAESVLFRLYWFNKNPNLVVKIQQEVIGTRVNLIASVLRGSRQLVDYEPVSVEVMPSNIPDWMLNDKTRFRTALRPERVFGLLQQHCLTQPNIYLGGVTVNRPGFYVVVSRFANLHTAKYFNGTVGAVKSKSKSGTAKTRKLPSAPIPAFTRTLVSYVNVPKTP
ncbi:MAG: hypothetical protein AAFN77_11140 [Planctomycetota bacterium]